MNTNTFTLVLLASSLACAITTVGIYVINKYAQWGNRNIAYFMSFAAGVLISVSIMHIMPEANTMHNQSPVFILIGFMSMYIINRFLNVYVCDKRECTDVTLGIIPLIGIGLHSFIDGVIYSVTFNVSIFTGSLAAIGMVLHEFPEGIVTFLLLEHAGFSHKKAVLGSFLFAAISTPIGTLVSFPFINKIDREILGLMLAVSAGMLLYVGATHLLPAVEKENKKYTLISLLAGILVAVVIVVSKG